MTVRGGRGIRAIQAFVAVLVFVVPFAFVSSASAASTGGFSPVVHTFSESAGLVQVPFTFDIAPPNPVTIHLRTVDGTATGGDDYRVTALDAGFPSGLVTWFVPIQLFDDSIDEASESFTVEVTSIDGASLNPAASTATITLTDDDDPPRLAAGDVSLPEDGGPALVPVRLVDAFGSTTTSGRDVTFAHRTVDGTAEAPDDYTTTTGTTTISAGSTQTVVPVPIVNDVADETAETFRLEIDTPTNASITDGSATVTVTDDDGLPTIGISAATAVESDDFLTLPVTLSKTYGADLTIAVSLTDLTTAGADRAVPAATLVIPAGETAGAVEVPIIDDTLDEDDETLRVSLTHPLAFVFPPTAVGTILDDDDPPGVSVGDVTVGEGDGAATVSVTLSAPSGRDVEVDHRTVEGTATATHDYTTTTGTLTIQAGTTEATIDVPITDDTTVEPTERLTVEITAATNATLTDDTATVTITDDDDDGSSPPTSTPSTTSPSTTRPITTTTTKPPKTTTTTTTAKPPKTTTTTERPKPPKTTTTSTTAPKPPKTTTTTTERPKPPKTTTTTTTAKPPRTTTTTARPPRTTAPSAGSTSTTSTVSAPRTTVAGATSTRTTSGITPRVVGPAATARRTARFPTSDTSTSTSTIVEAASTTGTSSTTTTTSTSAPSPESPGPTLRVLSPSGAGSGPAGSGLTIVGRDLPSCGRVYAYFDGHRIGTGVPDAEGNLRLTRLSVPGGAAAGTHRVTLSCQDDGGAGLTSGRFTVTAASVHRTQFATALPHPRDIDLSPGGAAVSLAAAGVAVLVFGFPSELFDSTFKANHLRIRAWLVRRRIWRGGGPRWSVSAQLALAVLVGTLLGTALTPDFGFDVASAILFGGMLIAVLFVNLVARLPDNLYALRTVGSFGRVKVLPGGLVVAAVCALLSRGLAFTPGYFYASYVDWDQPDDDALEGRTAAIEIVSMLTLGIAAWFVRTPVSDAAAAGGAWPLLVLEGALGGVFLGCLESSAVALLPLSFLKGRDIVEWSRAAWLALCTVVAFLVVHVLLRPSSGYVGQSSTASLLAVLGLFGGFGLFSIGFWAWFRFRPAAGTVVVADAGGT